MKTRARSCLAAALVLLGCLVGASGAFAATPYVKVPGSPFSATLLDAWSVAFNKTGTLLATVDELVGGVTTFSVDPATGALTATPGSPYPTGDGPDSVAFGSTSTQTYLAIANEFDGLNLYSVSGSGALTLIGSQTLSGDPTAVAFNPAGTVLAAASHSGVQTYSVSPTGLTPLESVIALSANESSLAFSPDGSWLAVTEDEASGVVKIYPVAADGTISNTGATTKGTGTDPSSAAFSPSGALLAIANGGTDTVSMFSFDQSSGALTLLGTPTVGSRPSGVAFSPSGQLLASANINDRTVSLFSVDAQNGALSQLQSPFSTGGGSRPNAVAFSPAGLLAVPDYNSGGISVFAPAPPSAQITSPPSGMVYGVGQSVATSFSCTDSTYGGGIASCSDSNGSHGPTGHLSTTTSGIHTYTVTATSVDGQVSQTTRSYTVAALPSASISSPKPNHTYRLGSKVKSEFMCEDGAFGPGLLSCSDASDHIAPRGLLGTATFGSHRYTVTAISIDGLSSTASISYRVAAAPAAAITVPEAGAHYALGQTVDAGYRCSDGLGGPGIASCKGTAARHKRINTSKSGRHTFKVTARSKDGFQASRTVTYFVS